jgi:hypothetical protein
VRPTHLHTARGDHHLPLGLVLPEVTEDLFLFWVVLTYPLQAALDPPSMYLSSIASLR